MKKIRTSTRMVIGFVVLMSAVFFGYGAYSNYKISQMKFDPIKPGTINLVAIDTKKGFKVIVANRVAQIVMGEAGKMSATQDVESERRRVPIRELLQSLQGNEEALGKFIETINKLNEDDLPTVLVTWQEEDLKKALTGDKALEDKLVKDLNVTLDGHPLPELRLSSLQNGIVVAAKVPVKTVVAGQETTLIGIVRRPYKPKLMQQVESRYQKTATVTKEMQTGYYQEESQFAIKDNKFEDVRGAINLLMDAKSKTEFSESAEKILGSATVAINDEQIESAELLEYEQSKDKTYTIRMHLTDDGVNRLWQYSKGRVGSQILLIVNGVAIAAPFIEHELAQNVLDITQLQDKVLAREAVNRMNSKGKK